MLMLHQFCSIACKYLHYLLAISATQLTQTSIEKWSQHYSMFIKQIQSISLLRYFVHSKWGMLLFRETKIHGPHLRYEEMWTWTRESITYVESSCTVTHAEKKNVASWFTSQAILPGTVGPAAVEEIRFITLDILKHNDEWYSYILYK